jgi:2,4-dienoyl-CoA reductase-like NADH-dependent reductase (Old Yellow Enzyme family)
LLAPSAIPASESAAVPRELDEAQIEDLVEAYGQAAKRVREAGFDAVQIHAAHGYLIGQFLSPASNKRQDEWGGSLENRARFLRRVAERVRRYVGPDYPVMVKLGLADFISGGMPLEDGLAYVGMLESMGINLLEISGGAGNGNIRAGITRRADEAYFLPWARQARSRTRLPIALVGGLRSLAVMQAVVDEGAADLISLSRPLIREPDLVMRLAAEAQDRASCISCMSCSRRSDLPTRCWQIAGTNAQEAD